ncbi:MAG: hypothetical protein WEE64_04275 [Dehalococcoidia bacterium]
MTSAAEHYAALVDAMTSQAERIRGGAPQGDRYGGASAAAKRFRYDPRRELDANLEAICSYVRAGDVVVDVGGGAGRIGLPLALRCGEVVNAEPSPAMIAEFESSAAEADITNARAVPGGWTEIGEPLAGDVAIAAHVTYFVRDIVPFIEKLAAGARRRVIIAVFSTPPPNMRNDIFRAVYDEELAPLPGHRELLPVLWDMGVLPDVRVLPVPFGAGIGASVAAPGTQAETVGRQLDDLWLPNAEDRARAQRLLDEHFDALFMSVGNAFARRSGHDAREVLITWETA